jgi:hypothetical protein
MDYRLIKGTQEDCISQHHRPILLGRGKGNVKDVDGQNTVCLPSLGMFRLVFWEQGLRFPAQPAMARVLQGHATPSAILLRPLAARF